MILEGDALKVLKGLPDRSVHMCVTSPPYYGLRDYGVPGQIGLEKSVEEYISVLISIFREVKRVLRPDGTLWLNIGDSYATRSGSQAPKNTRNSRGHTEKHIPAGYKYKDLMGIPWELAFALRADGWYLRDDIIWHKTNAMPEAVTDRPTRAHEYIFLFSKGPHYFYDAKAIAEPCGSKGNARSFRGGGAYTSGRSFKNGTTVNRDTHGNTDNQEGTRNKEQAGCLECGHRTIQRCPLCHFPPRANQTVCFGWMPARRYRPRPLFWKRNYRGCRPAGGEGLYWD